MTAVKRLHTTHGVDLFEKPDGTVYGWRGSDLLGWTWHTGAEQRARRTVEPCDYRVAGRHAGIAYVIGGCPDCSCAPVLCRDDDSGAHCEAVNCGYCLHGCSDDE